MSPFLGTLQMNPSYPFVLSNAKLFCMQHSPTSYLIIAVHVKEWQICMNIDVSHIYREGNKVADILADLGY